MATKLTNTELKLYLLKESLEQTKRALENLRAERNQLIRDIQHHKRYHGSYSFIDTLPKAQKELKIYKQRIIDLCLCQKFADKEISEIESNEE